MLLTNDQRFLLDILREVRYMRLDQILPLMRLRDPAKAKSHCEAILRYLRYAGELVPVGDDLVCLAEFRGQEAAPEMLCALDIVLSLAVGPPLQLTSRRPPYKLCFLLERGRESGKIDAFAVLPVEPGREQLVSILLAQQSQDVTVLLSLSDLEQHRLLHINQRHYFVIRKEGRLRFFKGGEASQ